MGLFFKTKWNAFEEVEKRLRYRFWDKERQRSNRAAGLVDRGSTGALCPLRHDMIAWSGPPHNEVRMYVCLRCSAYASEPMIKDLGYDFDTAPDFIIYDLMDEVLRQSGAGRKILYVAGGRNANIQN